MLYLMFFSGETQGLLAWALELVTYTQNMEVETESSQSAGAA